MNSPQKPEGDSGWVEFILILILVAIVAIVVLVLLDPFIREWLEPIAPWLTGK